MAVRLNVLCTDVRLDWLPMKSCTSFNMLLMLVALVTVRGRQYWTKTTSSSQQLPVGQTPPRVAFKSNFSHALIVLFLL